MYYITEPIFLLVSTLKGAVHYYNFKDYNYGKITVDLNELVKAIKERNIDEFKLRKIYEKHLNMCDGKSLERFIKMYLE